jgi:hypothetical protein
MGRYYSGDIEGKFMFGVQSSTAADRFGATYFEPNYVEYYFDEEQLETIKEQLDELREAYLKTQEYFKDRISYTDEDAKANGITEQDLSDYADYALGEKIMNCIIGSGTCSFQAEL